ncbi:radical SAM family heme chaperone HemW [Moheibacter sediminis]|uniref:Heme chaperone HemW n=1 Tax=Moheibacter sediminis TaxID=1434700 RepID=A0A1W2AHD3_9FLAO|nr:radical SAM family heme chaperone HemW [Moheibacter sediminis]SMC60105.1 oxygen-independent coproporphyrinogen-3 oxidase [Moheibacter sediminis]
MAGIYIHIPFCKQRCSYCDFHFSTNLNSKSELVEMIINELVLRKNEISEPVETIYFGGGTPSLLNQFELDLIFNSIYKNYNVKSHSEITIETNPDDLTEPKIKEFKSLPINRFSIGIQSFFDEDLKLMNRAHNSNEAIKSVKIAQEHGFKNITIDLIYGGQTTSDDMWQKNLEIALSLNVPHISSYALTIEPKTVLDFEIEKGKIEDVDETKQERHFKMLCETLTENNFIQYEISNFGKEGFFSQHNSNYWKGKSYLGVGPSAHSFDGKNRSWNIANNAIYIKNLKENNIPNEVEILSENERFNEMMMIGLRTLYGIDLIKIQKYFPKEFYDDLINEIQPYLNEKLIQQKENLLTLTEKGKFLADGIASNLFRV